MVGRGRVDGDVVLGAGDRGGDGVGRGQRLLAGRLQGRVEALVAVVGGQEAVVGRQHGLAVRAAEVDGAGVGRGGVAVGVLGGDVEAVLDTGRGRVGEVGDDQMVGRGRVDGDVVLGAGDRGGDGVGRGQRLLAGRIGRGAGGGRGDVSGGGGAFKKKQG